MITHGGISELFDHKIMNTYGFTKEQFYSLPYEYQRALILGHLEMVDKQKEKDNSKKRRALKQYEFEENVKKKVLSIFKKK